MIRFFVDHPTAANLLMAFLMVLGLSQLPELQRETFPNFAPRRVQIQVPYPGAGAEDVEQAICLRLEDALDGINEVEELTCTAREGLGTMVAEMIDGADFDRFFEDVKSEVEAIDSFPDVTERPVIRQLGRTDRVVDIAITGPMALPDLKAYAERIKDRMLRIPEISQVKVEGFSKHLLRVEVKARDLRALGLSISDIADAIRRQNIDLPAGSLETRDEEYLLRFTDERRTPRALAQLVVVSGASGAELRLGDIARISDRFEQAEAKTLFNGRRAAVLQVIKTKKEDTLVVMDAVTRFLDQLRREAPPGVVFTTTSDRSTIVRDRLDMLLRNGAQGLVLVFLAMWLFFRLRFAFWVAMGLPVGFLGALYLMGLLGYSVNMITMVALLIALGLLMDDAIVISENIAARLQRGDSARDAAVHGTRQVAAGVVSSFLTTVAVFGPLAFLAGDMGKVLKFIPIVLIMVLSVSLIEAFLVLPHHLAHALKRHENTPSSGFRARFDAALARFRERVLGHAIDRAIAHRYWFIGGIVGVFLISLAMLTGGILKFQAFPDIEGNFIEARLMMPQGTPLWRTETAVKRIVAGLKATDAAFTPRQPDGAHLVKNIQVRYNTNADAGEPGPHVATITADLLDAERRVGVLDAIIAHWRKAVGPLPDVVTLNFKEPTVGPAGIPVEITLSGGDLHRLKAAAQALETWLGGYRGLFNIQDTLRPGKPELRLRLREGALALGLDARRIAAQLRDAFHGADAGDVQVGREAYEVNVRLAEADGTRLGAFETFLVTTPEGAQVPLDAVAVITLDRGFSRIQRIDGQRTVTVTADLDPRVANAREITRDTQARFLTGLAKRNPGLGISVKGQARQSAKTGFSMLRGFLIGLIGIFILLSFQFRSYIEPLVVMAVIPLALVGVVWGHLLLGLKLSMPGLIGFFSLAGVVVNDSILLVEFLKQRARDGLAVVDAAREASRARFRAVLLTSLTTMAGLVPLMLERSLQAQILIPLAAAIVFGLLATTLLVLLVVPVLYAILADFGDPRPGNPHEGPTR